MRKEKVAALLSSEGQTNKEFAVNEAGLPVLRTDESDGPDADLEPINAAIDGLEGRLDTVEAALSVATQEVIVNRTAHGFAVKDVVIPSSSVTTKANASAEATTQGAVVVQRVINANSYSYKSSGILDASTWGTLPADGVYFLSDVTPGLATLTAPSTIGHFLKPVFEIKNGKVIALAEEHEEITDPNLFEDALTIKVLSVRPVTPPPAGFVKIYGFGSGFEIMFSDGSKNSFDTTVIP